MSEQTKIKKVPAYPIALTLMKGEGQTPHKANIVKMTEVGFLMKTDSVHFKVGDDYKLQFILPTMDKTVATTGKVVKTYDSMEVRPEKQKIHTVEIHFIELATKDLESIRSYLVQSGQFKAPV